MLAVLALRRSGTIVVILYNIFIYSYRAAIGLAALWQPKAKAWVDGRRDMWHRLQQIKKEPKPVIWVHSASAGEFEQAKPVIEALRQQYPDHQVLCSFFSPSGYAAGNKWSGADAVCYLPLDSAANATRFVQTIQPSLAIFIKYEWWYQHLKALHKAGVPVLMVSAIFRSNAVFFKWYGTLHRRMLQWVNHLFVQDKNSAERLQQLEVYHCTVSGDTRFDRVIRLAAEKKPDSFFSAYADGHHLMVAGSTWPDDEALLVAALKELPPQVRMIVAPHEITAAKLTQLQDRWPAETELYSRVKTGAATKRILVIDNVGMLSGLYQYAQTTYIGGGFNKSGIHNTLEAAVWGKPVLFGPNYQKFKEANDLVAAGAGASVHSITTLLKEWKDLLNNAALLHQRSEAAAQYTQLQTGATKNIIAYIQEKRLLTIA